ncbi:MAG: NAD(P)/FAD-dependent oxidoreductase [Ardenticatenaceae bacterium]|nr:NAD(P)/FAD-dependent oxidoreductase [Anaerolineales bacterium]MCB8939690.1 NAD(P)/FAD-dependent oxidoreductase [Ardenticatenaceae bacterium]MCB8974885.1 NAD(P)/FAD-dependent oxidoreductase [Ardenticatenaceae bacterium]
MNSTLKTDVVIIGGGPGGSTAAMYLAREGIQSIIVEKDLFPRYHIGESMTGECGAIIRDLGLESVMLADKHPRKHGVNVYGAEGKTRWHVPVMARDENNELQAQFTWQVRRSIFDKRMLEAAVDRGATLLEATAVKPNMNEAGDVIGVQVRLADGNLEDIEAKMVLDCSGQNTFLANSGITGPKYLGNYDKQIAIFSQVANTVRGDDDDPENHPDNTLIFYQKKYHWAWFIPLDDNVVSIGIVVPSAYFVEKQESKADFIKRELRELNPELSRRVPDTTLLEPARSVVNYSFQVKKFTGKGYICIGDAHRFLDPIFSFGLYVTMKEAQLASKTIKEYFTGANCDADNPFANYQAYVEKAIDVLEDSLDAFWEQPLAFARIVHSKHRPFMVDVFAGRIYEGQPSPAALSFQKLLRRERAYASEDLYSVPIGSRYHPERAPIWNTSSSVVRTADGEELVNYFDSNSPVKA